MDFWERLRRIMRGPRASVSTGRELNPNIDPRGEQVVSPPPTPPTMLNTLSISSDLTKIYLINDGRVHVFALDSAEGVTIGLLGDQLSVVTAKEVKDPQPDLSEVPGTANRSAVKSDVVKLTLNGKSAFNLQFNPAINALGIIGATDLISTIPAPDAPPEPSGNCSLHLFDLTRNLVRMRREKNVLTLWEIPK